MARLPGAARQTGKYVLITVDDADEDVGGEEDERRTDDNITCTPWCLLRGSDSLSSITSEGVRMSLPPALSARPFGNAQLEPNCRTRGPFTRLRGYSGFCCPVSVEPRNCCVCVHHSAHNQTGVLFRSLPQDLLHSWRRVWHRGFFFFPETDPIRRRLKSRALFLLRGRYSVGTLPHRHTRTE